MWIPVPPETVPEATLMVTGTPRCTSRPTCSTFIPAALNTPLSSVPLAVTCPRVVIEIDFLVKPPPKALA